MMNETLRDLWLFIAIIPIIIVGNLFLKMTIYQTLILLYGFAFIKKLSDLQDAINGLKYDIRCYKRKK